jgi:hypothetical protein
VVNSSPFPSLLQCRRRWTNHLSITAKTTEWTAEEDDRLVEAHSALGNKWMEISRIFGDRCVLLEGLSHQLRRCDNTPSRFFIVNPLLQDGQCGEE